jgi:spermidine/putrescine transport system permease protein
MAGSMLGAAERRRPWILLAPTLAALVLLMLVPIGIMLVYTFYKFQTAGSRRRISTRQLA